MDIRKIDELGRVALPIDIRKILNIGEKDYVEINEVGNTIVINKYEPEPVLKISKKKSFGRGKVVRIY